MYDDDAAKALVRAQYVRGLEDSRKLGVGLKHR